MSIIIILICILSCLKKKNYTVFYDVIHLYFVCSIALRVRIQVINREIPLVHEPDLVVRVVVAELEDVRMVELL